MCVEIFTKYAVRYDTILLYAQSQDMLEARTKFVVHTLLMTVEKREVSSQLYAGHVEVLKCITRVH